MVARLGPGADVLPIRLWAWVGAHQPQTGILKLNEIEIELICRWWGKSGEMLQAMLDIGFLKIPDERSKTAEGTFEVKDWLKHSGHLASYKKRAENASRTRWKLNDAPSIAKKHPSIAPSNPLTKQYVTKKTTNFFVPNPDEVAKYAKTIDFDINGEQFCDYYERTGWKIGRTPIKSWKAAVRLWKRNKRDEPVKAKEPITI